MDAAAVSGRYAGADVVRAGVYPLLLRDQPDPGQMVREDGLVPGVLAAEAGPSGRAPSRRRHGGQPLPRQALVIIEMGRHRDTCSVQAPLRGDAHADELRY